MLTSVQFLHGNTKSIPITFLYLLARTQDMKKLIEAFPENILQALEIAKSTAFTTNKAAFQNIVICGMGGSGIGGKIVAQWVADECPLPIVTINDYDVPAFVNERTLVIGSSYSGNTEETLEALDQAKRKGATIIGICSGGELKTFCTENKYDCYVVPGGNPPRTALAFSIVQLTQIFVHLGFTSASKLDQLKSGHDLIVNEKEAIHTEAKQIAAELIGRTVAIYATAPYEGIVIRTKQQFNENSKELCWGHVIPEMNHNELVGWGGGDNRYAALFLDTKDYSDKNKRRFDISVERTKSKTDKTIVITAKGETMVEKSIYLIHLIDWVSLYWSNLKNGDPIEIEIIDYLKSEIGKIK